MIQVLQPLLLLLHTARTEPLRPLYDASACRMRPDAKVAGELSGGVLERHIEELRYEVNHTAVSAAAETMIPVIQFQAWVSVLVERA